MAGSGSEDLYAAGTGPADDVDMAPADAKAPSAVPKSKPAAASADSGGGGGGGGSGSGGRMAVLSALARESGMSAADFSAFVKANAHDPSKLSALIAQIKAKRSAKKAAAASGGPK
jgi:hypothetical protein